MLYSFIHPGSGLGNQLHRIVAGKVLALDKGYKYSAIGRENFKGESFMDIDFGPLPPKEWGYLIDPSGKIIVDTHFDNTKEFEEKTNYYNPEFNFIEDNTIIDGEFQDERYFEHHMKEIHDWFYCALNGGIVLMADNICTIGFRGGEFYAVPELGLPKSYYDEAIAKMREVNPEMEFEVHTDDEILAKRFFPDFKVIHDICINWTSIRASKYSIIANSSFYILPRLLKHYRLAGAVTIAPRYWDRYNIKKWERPYNYYSCFSYI